MIEDRISKELYEKIKAIAKNNNSSFNRAVSILLEDNDITFNESFTRYDELVLSLFYDEKDVLYVRNLYAQFIKNYKKLNETLGLDNPMKIATLFYFLYKNGYLSYNKEFKKSYDELPIVDDYYFIYGVGILNGEGCCRHTSRLLIDLYSSMGISSEYLSVKSPVQTTLKINPYIDGKKQSLTDKYRIIKRRLPKDKALEYLNEHINDYIYVENTYDREIYNHAITVSKFDGKSYIVDPTINIPFRFVDGKLISYVGYEYYIFYKKYNEERIKEILALESPSDDKLEYHIDKITDITNHNISLFNKFYNENKKIYEKIHGLVKK